MATTVSRLVGLRPVETSGVDHPAHLAEGWLIMKSTATATANANTTKEAPVSEETQEIQDPTADLRKQLDELIQKNATLQAALDAAAPKPEPTEEELLKSAPEPVRALLEKARVEKAALEARAAAAEEAIAKALDEKADVEAIEKAAPYKALGLDPSTIGVALRKMAALDADAAAAVHTALTAATARDQMSGIFKEVGHSHTAPGGSAYAQMQTIAKSMVDAKLAPTMEAAIAGMGDTHPDLMSQYLQEKGA